MGGCGLNELVEPAATKGAAAAGTKSLRAARPSRRACCCRPRSQPLDARHDRPDQTSPLPSSTPLRALSSRQPLVSTRVCASIRPKSHAARANAPRDHHAPGPAAAPLYFWPRPPCAVAPARLTASLLQRTLCRPVNAATRVRWLSTCSRGEFVISSSRRLTTKPPICPSPPTDARVSSRRSSRLARYCPAFRSCATSWQSVPRCVPTSSLSKLRGCPRRFEKLTPAIRTPARVSRARYQFWQRLCAEVSPSFCSWARDRPPSCPALARTDAWASWLRA